MEPVDVVAELLAKWNPLEVPDGIAFSEYQSYAPVLFSAVRQRKNLVSSLIEILQGMGVEPSDLEPEHYIELENLSESIQKVVEGANV